MAQATPETKPKMKPEKLAKEISRLERSELARMFDKMVKRFRIRAKKEPELRSIFNIVAYNCHAAEDALKLPIKYKKK